MAVDVIRIEMLVVVRNLQRGFPVNELGGPVKTGAASGMAGRIMPGHLDL